MTDLVDATPDLRTRISGEVIGSGDAGYDDARSVYNAMIDRHPALVARCAGVSDVQAALDAGRKAGTPVAVRGGGHNGPGFGTVDGGIVIDLSPMHSVEVDPGQRTARVQGGATWGLFDAATHEHGLATPSGIISTTGVGGLTLGGGHGYLSRKYGLTIDNLLEAEVVLADGRVVTASESEHPDLFWALRGGGGNFGIVTSFTFRLHPVGNVVCGPTAWPVTATNDVLSWFRDFLPAQDDDLYGFFAVMTVPPVDTFPEAFHLHKACAIMWCYLGDPANATEALKPVRDMQPAFDGIGEAPYPGLQSAFDGLYPRGLQWYWRGDFFGTVPDAAVDAHARFASELPTMHSTMHLYPIDGAVNKVPARDTAWAYRDATFSQVIVGVDPDPANAAAIKQWTVDYWDATQPILSRRGVRELHDGRGPGPGASHLRRQLRPPRRDQGHLRPDQLVPDQPEHPARWLRPSTGTTRPTYKRKAHAISEQNKTIAMRWIGEIVGKVELDLADEFFTRR